MSIMISFSLQIFNLGQHFIEGGSIGTGSSLGVGIGLSMLLVSQTRVASFSAAFRLGLS